AHPLHLAPDRAAGSDPRPRRCECPDVDSRRLRSVLIAALTLVPTPWTRRASLSYREAAPILALLWPWGLSRQEVRTPPRLPKPTPGYPVDDRGTRMTIIQYLKDIYNCNLRILFNYMIDQHSFL
uniref:Uncharacterized protein n=1 Tax=Triticum urartu TaxID=4572 RepID=A0A8R7TPX7_TRIUA